jgi:hypothetical protein
MEKARLGGSSLNAHTWPQDVVVDLRPPTLQVGYELRMYGPPLWLLRDDGDAFLGNIPPGETGERPTSLPEPTPFIQRRSDRRQGRPEAVSSERSGDP